ncbi:hypothetical protein C8R43DRAFT_855301, partial [Mycena crocata]
RRQALAQPLDPQWAAALQSADAAKDGVEDAKTRRLEMEAREKRTVEIYIFYQRGCAPFITDEYIDTWPRLQISSLPHLVKDLELTPESRLDHWSGTCFKTIYITSVIHVEHGTRVLLKIRPSVREELSLDDCPGLADQLSRQPRIHGQKRGHGFEDPISPLKKVAKSVVADASQAAHAVIDVDADERLPLSNMAAQPAVIPASAESAVLPRAAITTGPTKSISTSTTATTSRPVAATRPAKPEDPKRWIQRLSICDWDSGWTTIKSLMDSGDPLTKTEVAAFPKAFDNHEYIKQTVIKYKNLWRDAPESLKHKYIEMGRVPEAQFGRVFHSDPSDRARLTAQFSDSNETELSSTSNSRGTHFPSMSPLLDIPDLPEPPLLDLDVKCEPVKLQLADPDTLCSFCDELLPPNPSAELVELRGVMENISRAEPLPENSGHRTPASYTQVQRYCEMHRVERNILPLAIAGKWPFDPDFSTLFVRIIALGPVLITLCEDIEDSSFFRASKVHYTPPPPAPGEQAMSMRQMMSVGRHYGEIGYVIFMLAVKFMFPDKLDLDLYAPLTYDIVLHEVLIPEAVTRIIQDDLNVAPRAARSIVWDSHLFGIHRHP